MCDEDILLYVQLQKPSDSYQLSEHSRFYGNNLKIKAVKSESCARVIPIMPCAWGSQGKREKRETEWDTLGEEGVCEYVCVLVSSRGAVLQIPALL